MFHLESHTFLWTNENSFAHIYYLNISQIHILHIMVNVLLNFKQLTVIIHTLYELNIHSYLRLVLLQAKTAIASDIIFKASLLNTYNEVNNRYFRFW